MNCHNKDFITVLCTPHIFSVALCLLSQEYTIHFDFVLSGPLHENSEPCYTCSNNVYNCSGHVGYIELSLPVVNPLFHKTIFHILKLACLNCHTLQVKGKKLC